MSVLPSTDCTSLPDILPRFLAALARVKPNLNSNHPDWSSLRSDLLQLSLHAESLSKHRPRAKKDEWSQRADDLDREGLLPFTTFSCLAQTSRILQVLRYGMPLSYREMSQMTPIAPPPQHVSPLMLPLSHIPRSGYDRQYALPASVLSRPEWITNQE